MTQRISRLIFECISRVFRCWDIAGRKQRTVVRRLLEAARMVSVRRNLLRVLIGALVIYAIGIFSGGAAEGGADTPSAGRGLSAIDGVAWMDIRDSSGVPLSNYMFVTDHDGLLDPEGAGKSMVLGLEFTVFMLIVISAIWVTGFVMSFQWLDWLGKPLETVTERFADQFATPLMLTVSVAIGAVAVAWFVVRGYQAKATAQVLTMLVVAVIGATYLVHPLAYVLASDGLLVRGRDVGISVAAGLNGNPAPDSGMIVAGLNSTLADNFARHPLQIWNFGHIVDDVPPCRLAWSSGVAAGNETQVARGLRNCGDSYASTKIKNPSVGQIGTGLMLLVFGAILLLFQCYFAMKVLLAALSAVLHALLAIFGFAAGGFIYGPTQTFLVRNLVGMVADSASMVVYTIFLGCYLLALDSVFRADPAGGMAIIFVGGMLLIAGFVLLRRLDRSLLGGQSRIVERVRAAVAGTPGAISGATTGMDESGIRNSLSPGKLASTGMRILTDFQMLNSHPVTSLVFRRPNPFTYFSKASQAMNYLNYEMLLGNVPDSAARGWMARLTQGKNAHDEAARAAVDEWGGLNPRAAAAAISSVIDLGGDGGDATGSLRVAGFSAGMTARAIRANRRVLMAAEENPVAYAPLARAAAALELADIAREFTADESAAYIAQLEESANTFRLLAPRPLHRDLRDVDHNFVRRVERHWDASTERFRQAVPITDWESVNDDTRRYIGSRLAQEFHDATLRYSQNPSTLSHLADAARIKDRAVKIDLILSGTRAGPWTN
ncbi:hypothetical protein IU470_03795 [Nocardia abscessus]|uniref:Amino acid transporter n=1 Tax=Nocardia abscessus TaxID=120957 RepID=A0ABS0C1K4_9NOCA|nr:hypothetical protein [Nocardia abscessus]MBF6224242.1 hypothetical protein [Nocardia abscessus]